MHTRSQLRQDYRHYKRQITCRPMHERNYSPMEHRALAHAYDETWRK
jgi:hypothetical protein